MEEAPEREPLGIPEAGVLLVIAGIVGIGAACVLAAWLLLPDSGKDWAAPQAFAEPDLEIRPVADYDAFLARQRADLAGAGGRMAIDEAMARIAARGAEAFAPLEGTPLEETK